MSEEQITEIKSFYNIRSQHWDQRKYYPLDKAEEIYRKFSKKGLNSESKEQE